jgi:hypothetical protein
MSRLTTVFVFSAFAAIVGCGSSSTSGSDNGGGSDASKSTIVGSVPTSGGTGTRTYGGVTLGSGVHVAAYTLHPEGAHGARVDVPVDGTGHFRLDVSRGARYVVNIENGKSASMVTFAGAKGVLDVSAKGGEVDVGALKVAGGFAQSQVTLSGTSGAVAASAAADEYFEAADGAIMSARDAYDAAQKATAAACADAKAAMTAAQEACTMAGGACGTEVDTAKAQVNDTCSAADATLDTSRP